MKKLTEKQRIIIVVVIVVLLMIAAFVIFKVGAARNVEYFYLQHVDENGFGAYVNGEPVYFHYPNASDEFRVCNTVRIAWWKSDEIREPYTYHHAVTGAEVECSVQVVKISVRKTIPWLGEPLYD